MANPVKVHRGWRYYTVRVFATVFILAGAFAIRVLARDIPSAGFDLGAIGRATVDILTFAAAFWTIPTIWGHEWRRRRSDN